MFPYFNILIDGVSNIIVGEHVEGSDVYFGEGRNHCGWVHRLYEWIRGNGHPICQRFVERVCMWCFDESRVNDRSTSHWSSLASADCGWLHDPGRCSSTALHLPIIEYSEASFTSRIYHSFMQYIEYLVFIYLNARGRGGHERIIWSERIVTRMK
jgi:hypothetical protein